MPIELDCILEIMVLKSVSNPLHKEINLAGIQAPGSANFGKKLDPISPLEGLGVVPTTAWFKQAPHALFSSPRKPSDH